MISTPCEDTERQIQAHEGCERIVRRTTTPATNDPLFGAYKR